MEKKDYVKSLNIKSSLSLDEGFSFPVKKLTKQIQSKLVELEGAANKNDKDSAAKIVADLLDLTTDVRKTITSS